MLASRRATILTLTLLGACSGSEPAAPQPEARAAASPASETPAGAETPDSAAPAPEPSPAPEPEDTTPEPPPPPPDLPPIPEGVTIPVSTFTLDACPEIDEEWTVLTPAEGVYTGQFIPLQRGFLMRYFDDWVVLDDQGTPVNIELPGWTQDIELLGVWPSDLWTFERQRGSTPKLRVMRHVGAGRFEPVAVNEQEWLETGKQEIRKSTGAGLLVRRKVTGASRIFERYGGPGPALTRPKLGGDLVELLELPRGELHAIVEDQGVFALETPRGRLLLPGPADPDEASASSKRWTIHAQSGWAPDWLAVQARRGSYDAANYLLVHDGNGWIADGGEELPFTKQLFVAADGTAWLIGAHYEDPDDDTRLQWILRRSPQGDWSVFKIPSMVSPTGALSADGTVVWVAILYEVLARSALSSPAPD